MKFSRITGIGSYLPPQIWKNDDLKKWMDTSDEWIQQRTGIQQRHWVDQNSTTSTSDLALEASLKAINAAKISKDDLDMIILATLSPDHDFPGTACFLQAKLEVPNIPALDIRQQCSGFIYAMSIADQFIRSETYKKILIVGAEVHSKGLDKSTRGREVSVLFGDGAGAMILEATHEGNDNDSKIFSTHLHADGSFAKELWVAEPGMAFEGEKLSVERLKDRTWQYPQMNGKTVFNHAVKKMSEVLLEGLEKNNLKISDVDLFIFHQANLRINEMLAKQLNIPNEKIFNTIQKYGNTTAATIPIGLSDAVDEGKLKKGMLVASAAFGSGFTWASAIYRW